MKTKTTKVLKLGMLAISVIISLICVMYIIIKPGYWFLKINTTVFAIICWFLTKKILINGKIFALMLINMLALYLMTQTSNQFITVSVINVLMSAFLFYRIIQMSKHKNTVKALVSCILYIIFGVTNIFLLNATQICMFSIISAINFINLTYLCVTDFNQFHPIEKELC